MSEVRKLTGGAGAAIARTVHRLLSLLVGMALLLSVGMAPLAHASEQLCLPGNVAAAALAGHVDGDADQAPDTERGVPHHHGGCHGHHFADPVGSSEAEAPSVLPARFFAIRSTLLTAAPLDRSLRPPIA
ncbi:hypothetical protein RZN05_14730 [Sphingomonas sp. HF-S4]|uniref:Uncharacterized protein n=1 Tax=Sphingomonas agrestis TaxID=3080540 RepID=A0ABU3YA32_9SPHN|nr:hypothetical protein [Sphingomonas sp. HF-S4]MDV3458250.1 hypothetical protein [Sphingomonas sp. HF-S4]